MSTAHYSSYKPQYHNEPDAAYALPNDTSEHVRLSEQGQLLSAVMDHRVIHAPLEPDSPGQRFLDIGCGTGIVTEELGEQYPDAEVYGLDISQVPSKPAGLGPRPPNVRFLQGNILTKPPSAWVAPDDTRPFEQHEKLFDYVFSRLLACGMTDWPGYIKTVHGLLKPGAFVEIHDVDFAWYNNKDEVVSDQWPWWLKFKAAAESKRLHFSCGSSAKTWMEEAGFVDIAVQTYHCSWGGKWAKSPELRAFGDYLAVAMPATYWHLIPKMMEGTGVTDQEIEDMRQAMIKDFGVEQNKHWRLFVTTGRRQ